MENQALHEKLTQLHEELARLETIDPANQALLQTLQADVKKLLARTTPSDRNWLGRWRQAVQHFEVSHPSLTVALEHVLDTLSNMGV